MLGEHLVLDREGFAAVLRALAETGHELVGPTVRDGAIVLDTLHGIDELPEGVGDEQAPGHYRLRQRDDAALFGYAASPHSWKRELLPPRVPLVQIRRGPHGFAIEAPPPPSRKLAFIGVRGCELAAIGVQDRVLRDGAYADADYRARREQVFVLAVHCGSPAGTCFCVSMSTGPRAGSGFDLAATEILDGEHRFFVEIGTPAGRAIIERVASRASTPARRCARYRQWLTHKLATWHDPTSSRTRSTRRRGSRFGPASSTCSTCTASERSRSRSAVIRPSRSAWCTRSARWAR